MCLHSACARLLLAGMHYCRNRSTTRIRSNSVSRSEFALIIYTEPGEDPPETTTTTLPFAGVMSSLIPGAP